MLIKLIILILAVSLLLYSLYFIYMNLPIDMEPEIFQKTNYSKVNLQPSYIEKMQFYPNMRFNHLPITYFFDPACSDKKKSNLKDAMNLLTEKANISFKELIDEDADIVVDCSEKYIKKNEKMFIAGEGGPTLIINTTLYSIIMKGKIRLFSKEACGFNVELHELLHVFGFDHSSNENSIMYPVSSCDQRITQDILDELIRLYGMEALPDLYFEDLTALKKSRYLDISFKIKNQGIIDAKNTSLIIYANDIKVERFELGEIEFGVTKILEVENLRLPSRNIKSLRIVIDKDNIIKEFDEKNNKVDMVLG